MPARLASGLKGVMPYSQSYSLATVKRKLSKQEYIQSVMIRKKSSQFIFLTTKPPAMSRRRASAHATKRNMLSTAINTEGADGSLIVSNSSQNV